MISMMIVVCFAMLFACASLALVLYMLRRERKARALADRNAAMSYNFVERPRTQRELMKRMGLADEDPQIRVRGDVSMYASREGKELELAIKQFAAGTDEKEEGGGPS